MWRRWICAFLLLSALACPRPAAANSPLPSYWDSVKHRRGYWIDVKTITGIRLLKCEETQVPGKVLCSAEVSFVAVQFNQPDPTESAKVPKEKIQDGQEPPDEPRQP
jgi:hypothetical protein